MDFDRVQRRRHADRRQSPQHLTLDRRLDPQAAEVETWPANAVIDHGAPTMITRHLASRATIGDVQLASAYAAASIGQ